MHTQNSFAVNVLWRNKQFAVNSAYNVGAPDFNDFSYQRVYYAATVMYKNQAQAGGNGNAFTDNFTLSPRFDLDQKVTVISSMLLRTTVMWGLS